MSTKSQASSELGTIIDGKYRLEARLPGDHGGCRFAARLMRTGAGYHQFGTQFGGGNGSSADEEGVVLELLECQGRAESAALLQTISRFTSLQHPHLQCCVAAGEIDQGELAGHLYLALEPHETTLAQARGAGGMLAGISSQIAKCVASALAYLHSVGWVHGAITGESIVQCGGKWKLGCPRLETLSRASGTNRSTLEESQADDVYALSATFAACLAKEELSVGLRAKLALGLERDRRKRCTAAELALADTELPKPVTDLTVVEHDDRLEGTWTLPRRGQVRIYASPTPVTPRTGPLLVDDLGRFGSLLPSAGNRAVIPAVRGRPVYVTPVTLLGSVAVAGPTLEVSGVPDVKKLVVRLDGKGRMTARWTWPAGIHAVVVRISQRGYANGPFDHEADPIYFERFKYNDLHQFVHLVPKCDRVFITVYAVAQEGSTRHFSSGTAPGCRCEVAVDCRRSLRYRVEQRYSLRGRRLVHTPRLVIHAARPTRLPELLFAGALHSWPLHPERGVTLCRVPAGSRCAPGKPIQIEIDHIPFAEPWAGRLFPANAADCAWLDFEAEQPERLNPV